jgi:hypothetical protein
MAGRYSGSYLDDPTGWRAAASWLSSRSFTTHPISAVLRIEVRGARSNVPYRAL